MLHGDSSSDRVYTPALSGYARCVQTSTIVDVGNTHLLQKMENDRKQSQSPAYTQRTHRRARTCSLIPRNPKPVIFMAVNSA